MKLDEILSSTLIITRAKSENFESTHLKKKSTDDKFCGKKLKTKEIKFQITPHSFRHQSEEKKSHEMKWMQNDVPVNYSRLHESVDEKEKKTKCSRLNLQFHRTRKKVFCEDLNGCSAGEKSCCLSQ